jgi:signal recognition particle receptor subunit beta
MEEIQSTDVHPFNSADHGLELPMAAAGALEGIGVRLGKSSIDLRQCGQALADLVEPAGQTLIREAISSLSSQAFRVVVVGQIKSGKSSFINALVRQPFLLPTDVTPWTTAITNLHFAEKAPGNYSAAFHFFSEDEWRELAQGGGPIRELTQRLVPGFDADLLGQHVEALKRRAGARLGSEFEALMGGIHYFESVNRDLLLHYVCSGETSSDTQEPALGKYADITKRADLYLDAGPFAFPVTVTDTPGTNDPFLIRDEITRRSLNSADLFIVVLSARQPLSDSDLALMRLMHGLNKDRIVAFVNRIDDFSDVSYDLAEVLIYVEKKLQAEFPGASIPVIAGSAAWANFALMPDAEVFGHILERRSFGYLTELGLVQQEDRTLSALSDPARRQRLCGALLAASGLPAMYHAVADRIGSSQAARSQLQVARCFREMAQASASSLRYELEGLQDSRTASKRRQDELTQLEKSTKLLNEVAENVERSAKNIEHQLLRIIDEEMDALRSALRSAVNHHAASERRVLIDTLQRGKVPRAWTHEGVELRRTLAEIFIKCFDRAVARVVSFQARVAPELHRLMGLVAPETPRPAEPDNDALAISPPNVAALSRLVALDLDGSWWSGFWKRRASPVSYGDQIEALIKSEFQPVVDELVQSAEVALSGYAATTTKWSFGLCVNIVQAVRRRREQMASHRGSVERAAGGPASHDTEIGYEQQVERLSEKLQQCQSLYRRLDAISNELGAGLHAPSGLAS